jgi:hypothetical protein
MYRPVCDIPCIRKQKGLHIEITESHISQEIFSLLPDEDKNIINQLKYIALGLYFANKHKT